MTRAEHIKECKRRALEYVDADELPNALVSLISDLGKHPDTAPLQAFAVSMGAFELNEGREALRRFIEGFN